jgi:hypothetical protein
MYLFIFFRAFWWDSNPRTKDAKFFQAREILENVWNFVFVAGWWARVRWLMHDDRVSLRWRSCISTGHSAAVQTAFAINHHHYHQTLLVAVTLLC